VLSNPLEYAGLFFCWLQTVVIHKAGGPLGLSIVGGADHTSHPFGLDEPGVFVSKVTHSSATFLHAVSFNCVTCVYQ